MRAAAVVVTFNRLPLLQESVAAVRAQTRRPDAIVVVDNGSTDGTAAWLRGQEGLTVVTQENLGCAGGFHAGIKAALPGHDWLWCLDDDTVPRPDCLERLLAEPVSRDPRTGFLCSLVTWTDGAVHAMNRPDPIGWAEAFDAFHAGTPVPVRSCSFVSVLVASRAVRERGLPRREFFIWFDDIEFTRRLAGAFSGYLVPSSVAVHKTAANLPAHASFSDSPAKMRGAFLNYGRVLRASDFSWKTRVSLFVRHYRLFRPRLASLSSRVQAVWLFLAGLAERPRVEYP